MGYSDAHWHEPSDEQYVDADGKQSAATPSAALSARKPVTEEVAQPPLELVASLERVRVSEVKEQQSKLQTKRLLRWPS